MQHPPTAVYKCIIPVKKPLPTSGTVYHSILKTPSNGVYFPAWPEIDDPYQPCCLPTLLRAVYFYHLPYEGQFEEVGRRAKEYLNKVVDREIRDALAEPNELALYQREEELGAIPGVIVNFKKLSNSVERVVEAIIQGIIHGNLKNFVGEEGAFAYAHEISHRLAGRFHCGRVLEALSKRTHNNLHRLATEKGLSHEEIAELWVEFWQTNERIQHLVQKFEPIEEIFATYIGLRYLPLNIRNTVKLMVKEVMEERHWYTAYEAFTEVCDNTSAEPLGAACAILDIACRLIEPLDIDGLDVLNAYLKQWDDRLSDSEREALFDTLGVPDEVIQSIEKTCDDRIEMFNAMDKEARKTMTQAILLQACLNPPVVLIGHHADNYITPVVYKERGEEGDLSPANKVRYESLRQQLSKRSGIVCPTAYLHESKDYCGWTERLQRLFDRLPEEKRRHLTRPE
ncbi:MAG TPA: hypothetical protein VHT73_17845 [Thermodesulfobacteriota bacterium]|nr:hypothetical protein [Thermodesulfobacteriota bacterium]